jgi:cyclopropane fatty-acyl-phospholipid synthase-like methyltransferase
MPESEAGLVPTLNRYGYMLENSDSYSQDFIDYASELKGHVLDIGAAYGVNTIPALRGGAYVIANDLDIRHLSILKNKTPASLQDNLLIMPGRFPTEVKIKKNSLDAVLASGVLHYLEGNELEVAFLKVNEILKSRGKFFFFTSTPYIKLFQKYLPIYEERKLKGVKWPGFIEDVGYYASKRHEYLPKTINLLDEDTLVSLFDRTGFKIEELKYVEMVGCPPDIHSAGREYIGVRAIKP